MKGCSKKEQKKTKWKSYLQKQSNDEAKTLKSPILKKKLRKKTGKLKRILALVNKTDEVQKKVNELIKVIIRN